MADGYPIDPPVEPMLARIAKTLPAGGSFLYEPKWDGFRAIVFRGSGGDVFIQRFWDDAAGRLALARKADRVYMPLVDFDVLVAAPK